MSQLLDKKNKELPFNNAALYSRFGKGVYYATTKLITSLKLNNLSITSMSKSLLTYYFHVAKLTIKSLQDLRLRMFTCHLLQALRSHGDNIAKSKAYPLFIK